jgi:hypothetical protein
MPAEGSKRERGELTAALGLLIGINQGKAFEFENDLLQEQARLRTWGDALR